MSRERPILFSGPMVRSILADEKTQTRRLLDLRRLGLLRGRSGDIMPSEFAQLGGGRFLARFPGLASNEVTDTVQCPYGCAGDRLWVRETWAPTDARNAPLGPIAYRADGECQDGVWSWRPSIFMPRWASRITLALVSVRAERLQSITEADVKAEGVTRESAAQLCGKAIAQCWGPLDWWRMGWDALNGARAPWASNPWVWRLEFWRVEP